MLRILAMRATFIELPAFERHRSRYLDDDQFHELQLCLMADPGSGDTIAGTGGLRKMRFPDARRGKGKRGGLRVVYFWWEHAKQFWLFTLYDKDEVKDLAAEDKRALKRMLQTEQEARR